MQFRVHWVTLVFIEMLNMIYVILLLDRYVKSGWIKIGKIKRNIVVLCQYNWTDQRQT